MNQFITCFIFPHFFLQESVNISYPLIVSSMSTCALSFPVRGEYHHGPFFQLQQFMTLCKHEKISEFIKSVVIGGNKIIGIIISNLGNIPDRNYFFIPSFIIPNCTKLSKRSCYIAQIFRHPDCISVSNAPTYNSLAVLSIKITQIKTEIIIRPGFC